MLYSRVVLDMIRWAAEVAVWWPQGGEVVSLVCCVVNTNSMYSRGDCGCCYIRSWHMPARPMQHVVLPCLAELGGIMGFGVCAAGLEICMHDYIARRCLPTAIIQNFKTA